jgi:hypothetical protein
MSSAIQNMVGFVFLLRCSCALLANNETKSSFFSQKVFPNFKLLLFHIKNWNSKNEQERFHYSFFGKPHRKGINDSLILSSMCHIFA